jgi:quercetin dioxygenase-like cupin family protein
MANAGDMIEHPVTGERFTFLRVAQDTHGEQLQIDFRVLPHGFAAAEHIHPRQVEHFQVISGTLRSRIAGKEQVAGPGEHLSIPAGVPHVWWNPGDDELRVLLEFRPALKTESFFETFFGLAQNGKVNKKTGLPNLLWIAVAMRGFRNEMRLARPPYLVQVALFSVLAPLGRLLGYRVPRSYPHIGV